MTIKFFKSPADFRAWLEKRHTAEDELWVGFHRKDSGKQSINWPESVDEALCFGWIDGLRKSVDEVSYKIRFTPRRPGSTWSAINIRRVAELSAKGRMRPAGTAAFELRKENKSGIYSYEQRRDELDEPYAGLLRRNRKAWKFFESSPGAYRRAAIWWVVSAKQEATRRKRLEQLIALSAAGRRIPQFTRKPKAGA